MLGEIQETPGCRSYLAAEIDYSRQALGLNRFTAYKYAEPLVALRAASSFKSHLRKALAMEVGMLFVTEDKIKECAPDRRYARAAYEVQGVFLSLEDAARINAALRLAAEVAERFAYK